MRFRKGSMVEVLTKKKDPSAIWRCAQIVEDDGDAYTVRYFRCPSVAKEGIDKVSADLVRPTPPPVTVSTVWAVGDVVEVLDEGYWRISMIQEVMENDHYYIQVIGSVDEFRVKKSGIRARQEWKGNQWVPVSKDFGIDEKLVIRMRKLDHMLRQGDLTNVKEFQESDLTSKTPKRSFSVDYLSTYQPSVEGAQKRRAVDKHVERHIVHDSYSFNGKVVTPVIIKETQCNDEMQSSRKTTRFSNASCKSHGNTQPLARTCQLDDCASSKSSVASCSFVCGSRDRLVSHSSASCGEDINSLNSDADSFYHKEDDEVMFIGRLKQEDTLRKHEQELYSYRSTLEALYACGPLSWELEIYLTNLRMKYSVSTDEHLMELRRLRSIRGLGLIC